MSRQGVPKWIDVVGAVIRREGSILCARRGPQGPLSGKWEFPGGKIEPGETAEEALRREIAEELRCGIAVGKLLTNTVHRYEFATVSLTTFRCELVAGEPTLTEHSEVQWLRPGQLSELRWAQADLPAVDLIMAAGNEW